MFEENSIKPNPTYLTWQQQDQALTSIIISSLSESLNAHALEATTAREVWDILEEIFLANSQTHMMQVHYQLTTLKKGSKTIATYYQRAKLLLDTFAAFGKTLTLTNFITFLFAGPCIDYDSIVTFITKRVYPLSPTKVYSHLLTHESRLVHQQTTLTAPVKFSTNVTQKQSSPSNRGRGSFRGKGGD